MRNYEALRGAYAFGNGDSVDEAVCYWFAPEKAGEAGAEAEGFTDYAGEVGESFEFLETGRWGGSVGPDGGEFL